jgi:endonuclease/exonuclease/phosphatase (EEP) superfamily protein YafD
MKVVVQNLQKRSHLGTELIARFQPDVLLAQEIHWTSEDDIKFRQHSVEYTSFNGYGSAIYALHSNYLTNVRHVKSPHSEVGGFITKKTTIATHSVGGDAVELVSFHGYNGQPFKSISKLVDHVLAVLATLASSSSSSSPSSPEKVLPAIWAGDFNTWSPAHLDAIMVHLLQAGFVLACSWAYPGRGFPLDHVFVRHVKLLSYTVYQCDSDHRGALLELDVMHPN